MKVEVNKFVRWLDRNFPPNTRRGEFLKLFKFGVIVLKQEGFRALFRNFRIYANLYGLENTLTFKPISITPDQEYKKDKLTTQYFLKILDSNSKSKNKVERSTVDIIIPVFNAYEHVVNCVTSVLKNSENCRIIIVNDASTDNRVDKVLEQLLPNPRKKIEIIYLKNSQNLGFVKTVNKAYKETRNHFVILNSDTEVPPDWLDRLFTPIFENENQIASVTPFANSTTIFSFPEFLKDNELFKGLEPEIIDSYFQKYGLPEYVEVPTGGGFCMAINKKVSKKIGMFDEVFGKGFGEENDWCQRARKIGFKNVVATNLFVFHNHGTSFSSEEKRSLQINNAKIISKKYPHYDEEIQKIITKDPLRPFREILSIIIDSFTKEKAKLVLIIDHNLGGGSNLFSANFNNELHKDHQVIHIKYHTYQRNILFRFSGFVDQQLLLTNVDPQTILEKVLSFFKIDYIIVNQLVTWDMLDVLNIIQKSKVRYSVYVHDYFVICPSFNLINFKGEFCGVPDISVCQNCLNNNSTRYNDYKFFYPTKKFDILKWRENNNEFLRKADKVICFSKNSEMYLKKAYPKLQNTSILEHFVPLQNTVIQKSFQYINKKDLTVGIVGVINHSKGLSIVKEVLKNSEFLKLPIKIVSIGYLTEKLSGKKNKWIVHGKYQIEELPSLLKKYDVDVVFITSITAETFSFTTAEVQILGYPILCFDLGAPAERIKKYDSGLIIKEVSSKAVIETFKKILKNPQILNKLSENTKNQRMFTMNEHKRLIDEMLYS